MTDDVVKDLGFDEWWHQWGSAMRPREGEDMEEHARRVAKQYEQDLVQAFNEGFAKHQPSEDGDAAPVVDESSSPEEGQG